MAKSKKNKKKKSGKPPAAGKTAAPKPAGKPCECAEAEDDLFYCFKRVQGRWVSCRGPYASLQECEDKTKGRCG